MGIFSAGLTFFGKILGRTGGSGKAPSNISDIRGLQAILNSKALKSDIPEKIIQYDFPHVQKRKAGGTTYIRNILTKAVSANNAAWNSRGKVK